MFRNLSANYLGELWVMFLQFATIPILVHVLGLEAYGLVAFHTTLTSISGLASLGVAPTLTREISRLSGVEHGNLQIRAFVFTICLAFLAFVFVFAVTATTWLVAPTATWLKPSQLSVSLTSAAVFLMFTQVSIQLAAGIMFAVLQGLQQHVISNSIVGTATTLRLAGVCLVLVFWDPSILAYFRWIIFATVVQITLLALAVLRALPNGEFRFSFSHITRVWRYAAGVSLTTVFSLLLTQIDKLLLSHLLPLQEFGIYALASNFAAAPARPAGPLSRTFLPRLTQLYARGEHFELARCYDLGCQIASVTIIPLASTAVMFPMEVMMTLGIARQQAEAAALLLRILCVGFSSLGLMSMLYCLTWATGWVRFGLFQNAIACLLLTPLTIYSSIHYGPIGAATCWCILTVGFLVLSPHLVYDRLKHSSAKLGQFYFRSILPPITGCLLVGGALKQLQLMDGVWLHDALGLVLTLLSMILVTFLSLDILRTKLLAWLIRMKQAAQL